MQTEIAVKKIFLCVENNRSKLSRFRNKFIQSLSVNMNEGAITPMELARPTSNSAIVIARPSSPLLYDKIKCYRGLSGSFLERS
jgi:hypothetical protein